ncbi:MAG: hypothetical protein ACRC7V_07630 [Lachnospiraceae bacterium]
MKRKIEGYMTIEASFLMPTVFLTIIFVLYIFMYSYNVILIKQSAYTIANRGSSIWHEDKNKIEALLMENAETLLENRLILSSPYVLNINITSTKIKVELSTVMKFPFQILEYSMINFGEISESIQVNKLDPACRIRTFRLVE